MSKKQGLGRHVNKSLDVMKDLLKVLGEFHKISIKKGLIDNDIEDDGFLKTINDVKENAYALHIKIEDIVEKMKSIKPKKNSRFACRKVVENFLKQE